MIALLSLGITKGHVVAAMKLFGYGTRLDLRNLLTCGKTTRLSNCKVNYRSRRRE